MEKQNICTLCRFLKRYESEDNQVINICEATQPTIVEVGYYEIVEIDLEEFDSNNCLYFGYKKYEYNKL